MAFLPLSLKEAGCDRVDFVLVSGDAYVDHPSFACALIGQWLKHLGYTVGIIAQPDFHTEKDFMRFGRPRLAFLIAPGNLDSMVNLYTANKHRRKQDDYAPDGKTGLRPKRACIVYSGRIRQAYGDVPIIIGGIEASLRRFAHYDYWDDAVRQSILCDSGADLLVYGMGEKPIAEIAEALDSGLPIEQITYVRGTCYAAKTLEQVYDYVQVPAFGEVCGNKNAYCDAFAIQSKEQERCVVQQQRDFYLIQNPPSEPLTMREMDEVYDLPFMRMPHPSYKETIPALQEVKFSITCVRGCMGGCAFCSIGFHQRKMIQCRSEQSILAEAQTYIKDPEFKGYIHDVGGPTANFYGARCLNPNGPCTSRRCLTPNKCRYLQVDHHPYVRLLRKLRAQPGIKKVFIRSGIRFDYALMDRSDEFIRELARFHVSGQLKLAPEHVAPEVLKVMGKPDFSVYKRFKQKFESMSNGLHKKQYILPYFISAHPGCTLPDAVKLAEYIRDSGFMPKQVQDFYPTPGTVSTCMYYTGMDPYTKKKVYVPKSEKERAYQRALMQFKLPGNRKTVIAALKEAGREDLIGRTKKCLIRE